VPLRRAGQGALAKTRRPAQWSLALLTTAVAFGLGTTAALAEDAPRAKSDFTIAETDGTNVPGTNAEGKGDAKDPGALSAPEKNAAGNAPKSSGGMSNDSSANVPGADADSDSSSENQGALSAPEKDTMGSGGAKTGGMSKNSSANVPGADADGDSSSQNQGALSAPEKDKM
jgi:hypothetical protein